MLLEQRINITCNYTLSDNNIAEQYAVLAKHLELPLS